MEERDKQVDYLGNVISKMKVKRVYSPKIKISDHLLLMAEVNF